MPPTASERPAGAGTATPATAPLTAAHVAAAATRIAGRVRRTPVVDADLTPALAGAPVALKLESLQHAGSFKARGAFARILAALETDAGVHERGVIAASGGNHGIAVATAARRLGVPCEIFVPDVSPPVKIAALRALGVPVTVGGAFYADAALAMARRAEQTGALVVHAYDDPLVAAGQGTVATELVEQCSTSSTSSDRSVDTVLVAVGGGGLLAGVAAGIDGRARVVAVEPARIPTLHAALAAGRPVEVEVGGVAADSLGARRIGAVGLATAQARAVTSVLVPDDAIVAARRLLWAQLRLAVEAGGAAALAALLSGAYRPADGERVAVIVCGGNTDPADLADVSGEVPAEVPAGDPAGGPA